MTIDPPLPTGRHQYARIYIAAKNACRMRAVSYVALQRHACRWVCMERYLEDLRHRSFDDIQWIQVRLPSDRLAAAANARTHCLAIEIASAA